MIVSRPPSPASIAGTDAPRIGERAATRGRGATEGGAEHAGVKRGAYPYRFPGACR
jgi:hypothetical protein